MEQLILVDRARATVHASAQGHASPHEQSDAGRNDAGARGARGARDAEARVSVARFARVHPHAGWREEVARLAGAPELTYAGTAEIARYAASGDAAADARAACFASPVYVQIGRYGGRLHRDSFLGLSRIEAAELIECFDADPPAADVSLRALPDGSLIALIPPIPATRTLAPENALDHSIDAVLPEGEGAASLRRLSTELEIWLHALPFNQTRVLRGSPPITTLWLWGCGARAESVFARTQLHSQLHIASDDAYLRGMAKLLGATLLDDSGAAIDRLLASGAPRAVVDGADLLHAAVAAVRAGQIKRLIVVGAQQASTLQRRDFFKIWRLARQIPT